MINQRLIIYNASAGSGKTFQIAKRYLNKLIQTQSTHTIYKLIGITFTNKAAEEMKKRIIENLINAAKGNITDVMAVVSLESENIIKNQTGIDNDANYKQEIIKRSRQRLTEILHYYDDFQLTTIDKLMYKIIKTFAREMHLSSDVDVILDYKEVISNLIDQLINRAEPDSDLSNFLISFAINKIDDDKFWDIKDDLLKITGIIFDDNHFNELKSLETKNLKDFVRLNQYLNSEIKQIENQMTAYGKALKKAFHIYEDLVNVRVLSRQLIYEKSKITITPTLKKQYEGKAIYYIKKRVESLDDLQQAEIKGTVNDAIHEILSELLPFLDENLEKYRFFKALKKEVNALSIENELQKDITVFKEEQGAIFISDFNKLILEQILKDLAGDTPYIYMRLGEKYAHYFIDEFQDTSALQWQNLIPLIREALSKEFAHNTMGDVMVVGDAKQSIYRFRGGKPEQFIALSDPEQQTGIGNPFAPLVQKKVEQLAFNWRSQAKIVAFNNLFFKDFTQYLAPPYKKVYEQASQKIPTHKSPEKGYVNIRFLNRGNRKQGIEKESFAEAVLQTVKKVEKTGFSKEDICILVNTHTEGIQIAETLNQAGIEVISSETLLVSNAAKVRFLLSWLYYLKSGASQDLYEAVRYLTEQFQWDKTQTYETLFAASIQNIKAQVEAFNQLGFNIDSQQLTRLNIYDLLVYLIDSFKLNDTATEQAYLQTFMEKVYQMNLKSTLSLSGFLSEWEQIAKDLSIDVPEKKGAVNIMTVHKSKGLEFPVIIYYTNADLYGSKDKNTKVWVPLDAKHFEGFETLPVTLGSLHDSNNPVYQAIYEKNVLEKKFDNLNRLYVAMTRAESQLYVITYTPSKSAKNTGFNQIFWNFLKRNFEYFDGKQFEFGQTTIPDKTAVETSSELNTQKLYYKYWQQRRQGDFIKINTLNYERWAEHKKTAITQGLLLHDILSQISTQSDWQKHKNKYLNTLSAPEKNIIEKQIEHIIQHPQLKTYFTGDFKVLNERSILLPDHSGYFSQKRPDRLLLKDNNMVILDYKTGAPLPKHGKQINEYANILAQLGFTISKKLLVYIGEKIDIKEIT